MIPFAYVRGRSASDAQRALADAGAAPAQFLAGGTNVIDLLKIGVVTPELLVDIGDLQEPLGIADAPDALRLGAGVRMAEAADHPAIRRDWAVLHESLSQAASQQIRQMASLGGNVLQRTRCNYFRDVSWACNKRTPGAGCSAFDGVNRRLAVLGVSEHCIANYPGDFAIALVALEAEVDTRLPDGSTRSFPFEQLHRSPGDTPHLETTLAPAELIVAFRVPRGPWLQRSLYLKVRDRESYDFALASAAVAIELQDGIVASARIGLGGLVARPWRSREAEAALVGQRLDEASARAAAEAAFAAAVVREGTAFKPELGRRTLVRAVLEAARKDPIAQGTTP